MCGRYALYGPRSRHRAEHEYFEGLDAFPDRYNVAPTQVLPIVRVVDGVARSTPARWGLVPVWAKESRVGAKYINAVSENLGANRVFGPPYRRRQRCLVPVCGFYEWEAGQDGVRQPYYFTSAEGELLAFAGLWDTWKQPDGNMLLTYTIMTVASNDFVARFHDRMPVVLEEKDFDDWLAADDPRAALKPCHNETLVNYPVSTRVNNVRNDDPSLIAPIEL